MDVWAPVQVEQVCVQTELFKRPFMLLFTWMGPDMLHWGAIVAYGFQKQLVLPGNARQVLSECDWKQVSPRGRHVLSIGRAAKCVES